MNEKQLAQYLTGLADDELVLAHRDSEWTGHAPILEEDIAFGNIALDELGHAVSWYRIAAELLDEAPASYPDQLVYQRSAADFRCVQLVELPIGDWAFTIVRQYLFDAYEGLQLEALAGSNHSRIAELAAKIRTEELYHQRHLRAWVLRLGLGTEQSNRRMQTALEALYPFALQLFVPPNGHAQLAAAAVLPELSALEERWRGEVGSHLEQSGLTVPSTAVPPATDRAEHTEHLASLVQELQQVTRDHAAAAQW